MSLDVYINDPLETIEKCYCSACDHEHERVFHKILYHANITHNLGEMASEAGLYTYLWRPEEMGLKLAKELISGLELGLSILLNDPQRFMKFNPANGWGSYERLVDFTQNYLAACKEYPEAIIEVSR